ncbi:tRNA (guanine37-N1)-methyltransferase [Nitrospina gracilis Nb-211]|nr:tRNA (guanosine(37)-N1)-methyltransferase TrmD [Nitrospina gracilis]MCF8721328.1 tRNA (guanine37-N1)-methyltransferase [Nitrospina gracilis Nb-211]
MKTIRFDIITIFPGMFASPFNESILKRAQEQGLVQIGVHDLREHTLDKHNRVDDYPFGGGAGMVMGVEPIDRAVQSVKQQSPNAHTILLSPSGRPFDQAKAWELSKKEALILVCGRYEGVDERVRECVVDEDLSVGDYVLSGGEIPAMVLVEAVSRLVPGVIGDETCLEEESFSQGLLEYPQYTRPRDYKGWTVPDVLTSGDHKKIRDWQKDEARKKTRQNRPDLLNDAPEGNAE